MRNVSEQFTQAVLGSTSPVVTVDIWLGGDVVRAGLKPSAGTVEFDSTRDVEGRLSLAVVDSESDGSALSKVIHAIGMRANVRAGFDMAGTVETVSLGWFDIYEAHHTEAWEWRKWSAAPFKTSDLVTIEALDLMSVVAGSEFLTPQQPTAGADAWTTIEDLCTGIVSTLNPSLPAKTIPAGLVFEWDRLKAIKDIAALWGATPVMTTEGQLTLVLPDAGDVTDDWGVRINVADWQDATNSADLHNGFTFLGKSPEGVELVGTAVEQSGLARWGGNYGRRPRRASSDLMTTQAMVDEAAQTGLANEIRSRAVTQTVNALWNPAVELRDRPSLVLPDSVVDSTVIGYSLPLTGGPMSVTLRLPMIRPFNPPPDWRPVPVPLPITPYPDTFYPDTTFPA